MKLFGTIASLKLVVFLFITKKWHEAGVIKIKDIFQNNAFLSFPEFCSRFKIKANFLTYHGVCHSIPREWVNILKGKHPGAFGW